MGSEAGHASGMLPTVRAAVGATESADSEPADASASSSDTQVPATGPVSSGTAATVAVQRHSTNPTKVGATAPTADAEAASSV